MPVRVAHSHNTGFQTHNPVSTVIGNMLKPLLRRNATHLVGCSTEACRWLFGTVNGASVLFNGIDTERFRFDSRARDEVRKELGLEGSFIIGHVGRFEKQKNHAFLLDVFAKVAAGMPDAALVMVGTGSLEDEMRRRVSQMGLDERVRFLGFRDDRERIMHAMDVFVMPSLYEGFSVTLIEAQASGLPVLASDCTTKETKCSDSMSFLSIDDGPESWADRIMEYCNGNADGELGNEHRLMAAGKLRGTEFDIDIMVERLKRIWQGYCM